MRRRREEQAAPPPPAAPGSGLEHCAMCGEAVPVGADGRCELGHRVRPAFDQAWDPEGGDLSEFGAATTPIASVGLEEPEPHGELLQALAEPLDLDDPMADDAAVTEELPGDAADDPDAAEDGGAADDATTDHAGDDETADDAAASEETRADQPRRPPMDLGGELDW